jgi:hypothetical protein
MNKFLISLFVVLILTGFFTPPIYAEVEDRVFFAKHNKLDDIWTNMTITGNHFIIQSDNGFYNGLEGDFKSNPWDEIGLELTESLFFESELNEENPHTIVEITWNGQNNRVSIDQVDINPESIIGLLDGIFARVTGFSMDKAAWPVDINAEIMESYPERYSISSSIIRGNDVLDYVVDLEAALIVTDYDIFALYFDVVDSNITYISKDSIQLDYGGQYLTILFNTFILGKGYDPSSLYYVVLLENGMYLQLSGAYGSIKAGWTGYSFDELVFQANETGTFQTIDQSTSDGSSTDQSISDRSSSDQLIDSENGLKLPFYSMFWFLLFFVPIIKKKINRNDLN